MDNSQCDAVNTRRGQSHSSGLGHNWDRAGVADVPTLPGSIEPKFKIFHPETLSKCGLAYYHLVYTTDTGYIEFHE